MLTFCFLAKKYPVRSELKPFSWLPKWEPISRQSGERPSIGPNKSRLDPSPLICCLYRSPRSSQHFTSPYLRLSPPKMPPSASKQVSRGSHSFSVLANRHLFAVHLTHYHHGDEFALLVLPDPRSGPFPLV